MVNPSLLLLLQLVLLHRLGICLSFALPRCLNQYGTLCQKSTGVSLIIACFPLMLFPLPARVYYRNLPALSRFPVPLNMISMWVLAF